MTAPVTRFTIATPVPSATRTGGYDMAYTDVVLASYCDRLEQENSDLRLQCGGMEMDIDELRCQVKDFRCLLSEVSALRSELTPWVPDLPDRIDAALQAKKEETPNAN